MPMHALPVLIVGAGPSGLWLALCLCRSGIPVRIIEKESTPRVGSRAAGIQPRTQELMYMLGVLPQARRLSRDAMTMRIYEMPAGRKVLTDTQIFRDFDVTPAFPFGKMWLLPQYSHEAILLAELAKYDCRIEYGTSLVSLTQDTTGVTADVVVDNTRRSIRALYLAGADGAKGASRKLLGLSLVGSTQETDGMVVCDAVIRGLTPEVMHIWMIKKNVGFYIRPLDEMQSLFNITVLGFNIDLSSASSVDALDSLFHSIVTDRPDVRIQEARWISHFRPSVRMVDTFGLGRAFVLGDVAHVHPPHGGQGLNTSVQDSVNLAWKLALVLKGHAPPSLLTTYSEERMPVIAQMLDLSNSLYRGMASDEDDRNPAAPVNPSPFRNGHELYMLGINYRWSSIVLDRRDRARQGKTASRHPLTPSDKARMKAAAYGGQGGPLCAGDRAPQAPRLATRDGSETSLFDVFDMTKHTLLLFLGGTQAHHSGPAGGGTKPAVESILGIAQSCPPGTLKIIALFEQSGVSLASKVQGILPLDGEVLVDKDRNAFNAYGMGPGLAVVVVRPDSYVGLIGSSSDDVAAYFECVFGSL